MNHHQAQAHVAWQEFLRAFEDNTEKVYYKVINDPETVRDILGDKLRAACYGNLDDRIEAAFIMMESHYEAVDAIKLIIERCWAQGKYITEGTVKRQAEDFVRSTETADAWIKAWTAIQSNLGTEDHSKYVPSMIKTWNDFLPYQFASFVEPFGLLVKVPDIHINFIFKKVTRTTFIIDADISLGTTKW